MRELKYKVIYNNITDIFEVVDSENTKIIHYSDYLIHTCEKVCDLMNRAYFEGIDSNY